MADTYAFPPFGTGLIPVAGEPPMDTLIPVAKGLMETIPPGLDDEQKAAVIAGWLVSSWRQGHWVGRSVG